MALGELVYLLVIVEDDGHKDDDAYEVDIGREKFPNDVAVDAADGHTSAQAAE